MMNKNTVLMIKKRMNSHLKTFNGRNKDVKERYVDSTLKLDKY